MDPLNLLTAEGWLRVLLEQPLCNLPNVVFCRRCRKKRWSNGVTAYGYAVPVEVRECHRCGTGVYPLREEFWQRVSNRIKIAYQRDKGLFARIKAETPDRPAPNFEGPLSWINDLWRNTSSPRGQPQKIKQRVFIALWINVLSAPRLQMNFPKASMMDWPDPDRIFEEWKKKIQPHLKNLSSMTDVEAMRVLLGKLPGKEDLLAKGNKKAPFGGLPIEELRRIHEAFQQSTWKKSQPRWKILPPLMTRAESIKVLNGKLPTKELKAKAGKKIPFGGFTIHELRRIRGQFQRAAKKFFGSRIILEKTEVRRILNWIKEQQYADCRIKGRKLRDKEAEEASREKKQEFDSLLKKAKEDSESEIARFVKRKFPWNWVEEKTSEQIWNELPSDIKNQFRNY